MAQNRNEEHEDHEESEYHFSDEEINYEVETEAAKPAPVIESKKNLLSNLSRSKRLILSAVVFFVLIFVVYKMLAPATQTPPEIIPVANLPASPPIQTQPMNTNPISSTTQVAPDKSIISRPDYPNNQSGQLVSNNATSSSPVIPVQQEQQNNEANNNQAALSGIETKIASLALENEKRINQMTSDYNQKLNDSAAQNKLLQDQVQLLTAKIGSLETQVTQLMQVLMNQPQAAPTESTGTRSTASSQEGKIPYNVQAIIPGRAWLKADDGETITVAEGDLIKGLGRVTKIDPYDGIVEVNTGSKAVSLSYGSNG